MPAIQLARLKIQCVQLVESADSPAAFCAKLDQLLDFYADRSRHPARAGEPPPIIRAYHVPQPVLKQIMNEIKPFTAKHPRAALALCDQLWQTPCLEFRMLSATILGVLPAEYKTEVLDRAHNWMRSESVNLIIEAILDQGLAVIRKEAAQDLVNQVESWLNCKERHLQRTGLRALVPMVQDVDFFNLPVIFRLITPWARAAPEYIRTDLVSVVRVLARRTPAETAFFLQLNLETPENPLTPWLIRQVLDEFPLELKGKLQAKIREIEPTKAQ